MSNSRQAGVTLIELLVVVAILAVLCGTTLVYSMDWLAKETMRTAAKDVQALLQLAKMEAISRNRTCRFVVDRPTHELQVWDGAGTEGDPSDDVLLHSRVLPRAVRFARPDAGNDITLAAIGGTDGFQALFASDGIVTAGNGAVHVHGGEEFGRVTVYVAGGVEIEYWNGQSWESGS